MGIKEDLPDPDSTNVVDPDRPETFLAESGSRIRIWERIISDPGSSGSEMNLK
jgi:hypothetical protein